MEEGKIKGNSEGGKKKEGREENLGVSIYSEVCSKEGMKRNKGRKEGK